MKKERGNVSKGVKTYVLTSDLGEKIKQLHYIGFKTPGPEDNFYKYFNEELIKKIKKIMPDCEVRVISMKNLGEEILMKAFRKSRGLRNAIVVSSCTEISAPSHGHTLEINRIVDGEGKIVGIGARPGYPTIGEQINGIASVVGRKPVVLVEDGSFSGNTMCNIVRRMKKKGVVIAGIVLGFAFPDAIKAIKKEYDGEVTTVEKMEGLVDWMPDHDFFPFAPNCGRTFGMAINGNAFPFYTHDGASYSIPYILPFAPMTDWTSIPTFESNPGNPKGAEDISLFCLQASKELFDEIGKMNRRVLKIGDLVGSHHVKVSIPIAVGQTKFYELMDKPIIEYLKDIYAHGILYLEK